MRDPARCRGAVAVAAVTGVLVTSGVAAYADFTATRAASQQIGTARLAPPANPAAAPGTCTPSQSDGITVSWTPTPSEWAGAYEVLRATEAAGPFVVVATPAAQATSYADSGLAFGTTFHYVVRAARDEWRSTTTATVSLTTRTASCG